MIRMRTRIQDSYLASYPGFGSGIRIQIHMQGLHHESYEGFASGSEVAVTIQAISESRSASFRFVGFSLSGFLSSASSLALSFDFDSELLLRDRVRVFRDFEVSDDSEFFLLRVVVVLSCPPDVATLFSVASSSLSV